MKKNAILLMLACLCGCFLNSYSQITFNNLSFDGTSVKNTNDQLQAEKYHYFKGDTLNDFDFIAAFKAAMADHTDNEAELPGFIYKLECDFVASKYHISPPCFKYLYSHEDKDKSYRNLRVLGSSCNNVDFENGNFTGWTGAIGYNSNSNASLTITTP